MLNVNILSSITDDSAKGCLVIKVCVAFNIISILFLVLLNLHSIGIDFICPEARHNKITFALICLNFNYWIDVFELKRSVFK